MVFTAPLSYDGDDRVDISRMGQSPAGLFLAPSEAILWPHKRLLRRDRAAFEKYRTAYTSEMRVSFVEHRSMWDAMLARSTVTLCCYCVNASACHRKVAAELLVAASRGNAVYEGER